MRVLISSALLVAAAVGTARADEGAPAPHGYAPLAVMLSAVVRDDRGGGTETTSAGAALEVAIGSGRFQYFGEGSLASIRDGEGGSELRGGGGIRWLARAFDIGPAALEMHLEGVVGYTRASRDDLALGMTVSEHHPDIGFGVGWAIRVRDPRMVFRISTRAVFAQTARDQASASVPGFVVLFGVGY